MRLSNPCLTLFLALMLTLPASADPSDGPMGGGKRDDRRDDMQSDTSDWAPEFAPSVAQEFRVIALRRAIQIVGARFRGRVIAARMTGPDPDERDRGVVLVQELRLLTPTRDVLRIRLDARTGDFLEVAGRGMTQARKTRSPE